MTGTATSEARVGLLRMPDATIHFEVRGAGPPLLLHAAPMDARAFESLAVVTSDPRGSYRSSVSDRSVATTPDHRAEDLADLFEYLDLGPAAAFGSSGGAVSALALAQRHPGLVSAVVAHEPPLIELLDQRYGVEQMQLPTTTWRPDLEALADGSVAVIPAVGSESRGQLCDRTTRALAHKLACHVVEMPGDHTGFDESHAFAAEIRQLLACHDPEE